MDGYGAPGQYACSRPLTGSLFTRQNRYRSKLVGWMLQLLKAALPGPRNSGKNKDQNRLYK